MLFSKMNMLSYNNLILIILHAICLIGNLSLIECTPITDLAEGATTPADGGSDRRIIDFDNIDPDVIRELATHNISVSDLRRQQEHLKAHHQRQVGSAGPPVPMTELGSNGELPNLPQNDRKQFENFFIGEIKKTIASNVMRSEHTNDNDTMFNSMGGSHSIAFQPVCDMPKNTNDTFWFNGNTLNLFFSPPHKRMNVSSAILRLYKIDPTRGSNNLSETSNCTDQTEQLLRITAFVYIKKNHTFPAERQKKICSCITESRTYQGWIELDIKLAVKQWEKPSRNLGLAIDVQDQDDNYLKAAPFFHLKCIEASPKQFESSHQTIPWHYYWDQSSGSALEMDRVPRHPRVDITYSNNRQHNYYYRSARQSSPRDFEMSASSISSSSSSSEHTQPSAAVASTLTTVEEQITNNHHNHPNRSHRKRHLQHKFQQYLHNKHKSSSELGYTL